MREVMGVGVVGCGNISVSYLKNAAIFENFEVRSVSDINMDLARTRAEEFGVRAESVAEMLASDDIDVVINLTIPAAHKEVTISALQSGKHVYSEKPFVLSVDEAAEIRALADEKGLRVGSAPDTFLGGTHQFARQLVEAGEIGRIVGGTAAIQSRGPDAWHPNPDFFYQPGGGPILDMGVYYVTNLVQLIGPVKRVTAVASTPESARTIGSGARAGEQIPVDTPTTFHSLLEFQSGAVVTLLASWDVWDHCHKPIEIYGTTGAMVLPDPNLFGGTISVARRDKFQPEELWAHPFAVPNKGDEADYRGAGLADMVQAIHEGRAHRCSLDLATHVVDVLTGIQRAGETGTPVTLTTTCGQPDLLDPETAKTLMKIT